jgi:hypothetical protein
MIAFFAHAAAAFAAAFVFSALASVNPAAAQPPPTCAAGTLGATACLGSKLCACTYDRGGIASGVPAGYRWDCGILRPGCGTPVHPPATLNPYEGPYPEALDIDRSHRSVTIQQTNTGPKAGGKIDMKSGTKTDIRTNRLRKDQAPDAPAWSGMPLPLLPPD